MEEDKSIQMVHYDNLIWCMCQSDATQLDIDNCKKSFKDFAEYKISYDDARAVIAKYREAYNISDGFMNVAEYINFEGDGRGGYIYLEH